MEGLLNLIVCLQLTIGPLATAYELDAVPNSADAAVMCLYFPALVAYTQSPTLEVSLDEIMDDYRALVRR